MAAVEIAIYDTLRITFLCDLLKLKYLYVEKLTTAVVPDFYSFPSNYCLMISAGNNSSFIFPSTSDTK